MEVYVSRETLPWGCGSCDRVGSLTGVLKHEQVHHLQFPV